MLSCLHRNSFRLAGFALASSAICWMCCTVTDTPSMGFALPHTVGSAQLSPGSMLYSRPNQRYESGAAPRKTLRKWDKSSKNLVSLVKLAVVRYIRSGFFRAPIPECNTSIDCLSVICAASSIMAQDGFLPSPVFRFSRDSAR